MAIINSSLVQGSQLKPSATSTVTYLADEILFTVGGISITQRQLVTGGICFLAAWALKD